MAFWRKRKLKECGIVSSGHRCWRWVMGATHDPHICACGAEWTEHKSADRPHNSSMETQARDSLHERNTG